MYDLVLKGGLVLDGTGSAPYHANVCVKDGRIASITTQDVSGDQVLDVTGLAVAPGFIDIHTHSDMIPFTNSDPDCSLRQGVTTMVTGNCGTSVFPCDEAGEENHQNFCSGKGLRSFRSVTDYNAAVTAAGISQNYASLLGHSNLRVGVMGFTDRPADPDSLAKMEQILEREMLRGAFGMSVGLIYPPSAFCHQDELVALSRVIAKYDGILAVHMRNESVRIFQAVDEVLEIAERSGVHLQISHLKLMGKPQWGKTAELLAKIDQARSRGVKVTCDQYPFPASSTGLTALVPKWAFDGGIDAMLDRLKTRDNAIMGAITQETEARASADAIMICDCKNHPEYVGKTIAQLSQEFGVDVPETVCRVLLESDGSTNCIYFCISPQDMHIIMKQDYVCVGSDGYALNYNRNSTRHPRSYATFSQYFQTVRENNLLPLEQMVRKATGLTAQILGLKDRGILAEGNWADIAVFDPNTFSSNSTFLDPSQPPSGMYHVIVNGKIALLNEEKTGVCSGMTLLKN